MIASNTPDVSFGPHKSLNTLSALIRKTLDVLISRFGMHFGTLRILFFYNATQLGLNSQTYFTDLQSASNSVMKSRSFSTIDTKCETFPIAVFSFKPESILSEG